MAYKTPYTKKGVYYAGDSGLSEADFKAQRTGGTLSYLNKTGKNQETTPLTNTIDHRLSPGATGSGTQDAPWYESQLQANPTGIFSPNDPTAATGLGTGQYQNAAATSKLGTSQVWQSDPNLANVSKAIPQMLGYDEKTGKYDSAAGSIVGGPGQAFNPAQLQGLYAQGMQALNQNNKATMAGLANSQASRGTAGMSMGSMMAGRDAADRGALARGNLDAQLQGLNLGLSQYNSKLGAFNSVSGLADAEQARNMDTQKLDFANRAQDKGYWQGQSAQDKQAINNAYNSMHAELAQSSGSAKKGQEVKDRYRKMIQDLQRNYQYSAANADRYS